MVPFLYPQPADYTAKEQQQTVEVSSLSTLPSPPIGMFLVGTLALDWLLVLPLPFPVLLYSDGK